MLNPEPTTNGAAADCAGLLLTPEGLTALEAELDELRRRKHGEFAERLRDARGAGEDDYLAIKEEESVLDAHIARLETLLDRAVVLDPGAGTAGLATIGSVVRVVDVETGRDARYRIAGMFDGFGMGMVSAGSPIGRALLGRAAGEEVTAELPDGRVRRLRVAAVEAGG